MSEKRSYPTSVVRGSSREYQAVTVQEQPRGVTPHQRSGGTAERSYPASEIRGSGQEGIPHAPKPKARGDGQEELPHPIGSFSHKYKKGTGNYIVVWDEFKFFW